ncbi:MAG: hypothetical protein K9M10_04460 [Candidatus Pacebacteria bacterium]|nr:hypothetical protein [Candidatus Paceibacterota bacterium]MCF7857693.1 hypothetical protein [Candidatus Paceibacterota bacterium]
MKKEIIPVVSSFMAIILVTSTSSFLYQKQVYIAEQIAHKIQKQEQLAYEKEQERLALITKFDHAAEVARLEKEDFTRKEAEKKIAQEALLVEEARIAAITNEVERQRALTVAAEVKKQAALVEAQKKTQALAAQIALDAKIAAEKQMTLLATQKAAAAQIAATKSSRRSRAS